MAHIEERGKRFSQLVALELKGAIAARGQAATKVAAAIGVDYSTLHRYFKGQRALPTDVLSEACEQIGVDPAELVDRAYVRLVSEMGPYLSGVEYILAADGNTESDAEVEAWEQQP